MQSQKAKGVVKPEPEEPDWLKDVLEAPRSANNSYNDRSIISSSTDDRNNSSINLNQTFNADTSSMQESLVSNDSAAPPSLTTTDSLNLSRQEASTLNESNCSDAEASEGESNYSAPEYPPVRSKEVFVNQDGVHFYEDGNFWMEVPGLMEYEQDEEEEEPVQLKRNTKVKFSTAPMQVFSTFSVNDYDRRNEDVDPVAASAEYELEKRVEKMDVFPVELMKGPEGLGLSIIGS